jgi:hypothetical protein
MPRNSDSPMKLRQHTLLDFVNGSSPMASSSVPKKRTLHSSAGAPTTPHKRSPIVVEVPDVDSADDESPGSDVDAVRFEPRKVQAISVSDDEDQSPRRPKASFKTQRTQLPKSRSESPISITSSNNQSDEKDTGVPARWKGKGVTRRRCIADSASEPDEQPKRRKLVKGVRPPTPEEPDDLLNEVDEEGEYARWWVLLAFTSRFFKSYHRHSSTVSR